MRAIPERSSNFEDGEGSMTASLMPSLQKTPNTGSNSGTTPQ